VRFHPKQHYITNLIIFILFRYCLLFLFTLSSIEIVLQFKWALLHWLTQERTSHAAGRKRDSFGRPVLRIYPGIVIGNSLVVTAQV
jgi:hypothetical protein